MRRMAETAAVGNLASAIAVRAKLLELKRRHNNLLSPADLQSGVPTTTQEVFLKVFSAA